MRIVGLDALERDFRRLTEAMSTPEVKQVFRKAASKIRDRARANAPKKSGLLKRSIISFASKKRGKRAEPAAWARVNVLKGRVQAPHGHLVEFGTKERRPKPGRRFLKFYDKRTRRTIFTRRVAAMPAKPFFAPAVRQSGPSALQQAVREVAEKIAFSSRK